MPKLTDSIQKMFNEQESLRKLYEPSESMMKMFKEQESLRKLYEPSESILKMFKEQESLRKLYEPSESMMKMFKEQESLRKLYEPSESILKMFKEQESLRKLYEPSESMMKMFREQESLRKLYQPSESIMKMFEGQKTFREMFSPSGAVAAAFQTLRTQDFFSQSDITDKIKNLSEELDAPEFQINSDGSLSLGDQSINVSELNIAVHNFFEEISKNFSTENILSHLACLQKPAKRIAVWILNQLFVAFFVSVMAGIYTPKIQDFFNSNILRSKREVTDVIKKIPSEINLDDYKGYRVITAEILNLRQKPNMQSAVIAKLHRGKLVYVIQKKKNWTKVEFESSNSTDTIEGWVSTRYIVPLKR